MYSTYSCLLLLFFFNDTAPTEIYTLSLHDALPIYGGWSCQPVIDHGTSPASVNGAATKKTAEKDGNDSLHRGSRHASDRKSTRLNSSHSSISYAVFCLKKKNKI